MGYDLAFWKQAPDLRADPQSIYLSLMADKTVAGLLPFPIEDFVAGVQAAFPNATPERSGTDQIFWLDEHDQLLCEMGWSPLHLVATLRPLNESLANRLIDIAASLDAPLYDPQVNERFAPQHAD